MTTMNPLTTAPYRAIASRLQRNQLLPSPGMRIYRSRRGQRAEIALPIDPWTHPWSTRALWNAERKRWEAIVIVPGSVNAIDPLVPGQTVVDGDTERPAGLCDFPRIPLTSWRSPIANGEKLQAFFAAKGVRSLKSSGLVSGVGGFTVVDSYQPESSIPPRTLIACNLYLAKARATYKAVITEVDGTGSSGVVFDYSVTYGTETLDRKGVRARLQTAAEFPAIHKPTFAERLLGTYEDEGEDRLSICNIFLLSPPNEEGITPDERWMPYVQHDEFWPLKHVSPITSPKVSPKPIRIFTGLAGGIGDSLFNQILSSQNEASQRIINAVNNTVPEGDWSLA